MKKNYNTPKVEKLAFNYTETVTASDIPDIPSNKGGRWKMVSAGNSYAKCTCPWTWKWIDNC